MLADLGSEGERERLTCPYKTPTDGALSGDERQFNLYPAHVRARAEQGNAWLKNYWDLRKVSLCPWRIGVVVAAVLVVFHLERDRTT